MFSSGRFFYGLFERSIIMKKPQAKAPTGKGARFAAFVENLKGKVKKTTAKVVKGS